MSKSFSPTRMALFSTAAAAAVCICGHAALVHIGSVDVGPSPSLAMAFSQFGKPVRRLRFTAQNDSVTCRSVQAIYEDGTSDQVFSGQLRQNQSVDADVPGRSRDLDSLSFDCRTNGKSAASIDVVADVSRFEAVSDRGRADFGHEFWRAERRGWRAVARAQFYGHNDRVTANAGLRARRVDRIALQPTDGDVRCMQVSATFGNGHTYALAFVKGEVLRRGHLTVLDLPGLKRDVYSVHLRCSTVGGSFATVRVLAHS